jgi:hypothetical protein
MYGTRVRVTHNSGRCRDYEDDGLCDKKCWFVAVGMMSDMAKQEKVEMKRRLQLESYTSEKLLSPR